MTPDIVNGIYEAAGAAFILRNCLLTWRAKDVKGVSILTTTFFTSWGIWNLYYYPALEQWFSFAGGVAIVLANFLWIGLMIEYTRGWFSIRLSVEDRWRRFRSLADSVFLAVFDWHYAQLWWDGAKERRARKCANKKLKLLS